MVAHGDETMKDVRLAFPIAVVAAGIAFLIGRDLFVLVVASAPLLTYSLCCRAAGKPMLQFDLGLLIAAAYAAFFPVRTLGLAVTGWTTAYPFPLGPDELQAGVFVAAPAVSAFLAAYVAAWNRGERFPGIRMNVDSRRLSAAAIGVTAAALIGLAMVVGVSGSVEAAFAKYSPHSKAITLSGLEALGLALWLLAAGPGTWLAAARMRQMGMSRAREPRGWLQRSYLLGASVVILAASILVFASRRDMSAILIGVTVVQLHGRRPHLRSFVLAGISVVALSVAVVAFRVGDTPQRTVMTVVTENLGHSILESLSATIRNPAPLAAEVRSPSRWIALAGAWIPGHDRSHPRLDEVIAQELAGSVWRDSGIPGSALAEWYALGGMAPLLGAGIFLGALAGLAEQAVRPRLRDDLAAAVLYSSFLVLAFSYFKDGDALLTAAGMARQPVLLALGLGTMSLLSKRASPIPRHCPSRLTGPRDEGRPSSRSLPRPD